MNIGHYQSSIGWLKITATASAVKEIEYIDKPAKLVAPTGYGREVVKQLDEYFQGKRKQFDLKLERSAPDFTFQVWRELENIPYGQVKTYGQVAQELGSPRASRAVGNACHVNPIAIIVPCHRVVGSSPQAGGYASGTWRKDRLLKHERAKS